VTLVYVVPPMETVVSHAGIRCSELRLCEAKTVGAEV